MEIKNLYPQYIGKIYKDYNSDQSLAGILFHLVRKIRRKEFVFCSSNSMYVELEKSDNTTKIKSVFDDFHEGEYVTSEQKDENNNDIIIYYQITFDFNNFCKKIKEIDSILEKGFEIGLN